MAASSGDQGGDLYYLDWQSRSVQLKTYVKQMFKCSFVLWDNTVMRGAKTTKQQKRNSKQIELAQYFTPTIIAKFMAEMFEDYALRDVKILDPGAGEGILGLTLAKELLRQSVKLSADFIELDEETFTVLAEEVKGLPESVDVKVANQSFIDAGIASIAQGKSYSHIILNPPYFKLGTNSSDSIKLRHHGIHTPNIYAAFVWLSALLLSDNGQLVAIIPRSFCNGPYFQKFREFIGSNFSIEHIHTFESRDKAFSKDKVLQENIIIRIAKRRQSKLVKVTYSNDQSFSDIVKKKVPFQSIINPSDPDRTIHIPLIDEQRNLSEFLSNTIHNLGLKVSTGPVVDFRLKDQITDSGAKNSVPLLYPSHVSGGKVVWPIRDFKKIGQYYKPTSTTQNLTLLDEESSRPADKNVLPLDGHYVVVRRFSSKEEKRRIFATVVSPSSIGAKYITFENHLNYFHNAKHGFDKEIAYGLCAYLNSTVLDKHFRKISGHTQVNVTDLKNIPYPEESQLRKIGGITEELDNIKDDVVTKEIFGVIA